jgi:hypothetical protein
MSDNLAQAPGTFCVSKATLAASGAATTWSTTGATLYCIKGEASSTAAASGAASPTTDIGKLTAAGAQQTFASQPLAANTGTVFLWMYDGTGTAATAVRVAQGSVEPLDASGAFINAPQFPIAPDNLCAFAYTVIRNGSTGSNWTFGTSNWNATGITLAHQDIMTLPGRPQVA